MKKFTHFTCYLALAFAYGGAFIGLDKSAVMAATSILYFLLAMDEISGSGGHK